MEISEETCLVAINRLFRNRIRKACETLRHYGSAVLMWKELKEDGMAEALEIAKKETDFITRHGINVLSVLRPEYPQRLSQCYDAPLVMFCKGNMKPDKGKLISVVGTRNCTERGKELARQLVTDLAHRLPDVTIVSGLAYGIDIAAHRAALEAGIPTIAILGHGLDRIYPACHRNVAVESLKNGGLMTEYPSKTEPDRFNFIARDRIIAGISDATVVVESKEHGGSLITARMAFEYSRQVFAFPGRVRDECSRGCNQLIRSGRASLIESADDLIEAMMWESLHKTDTQTSMIDALDGMSDEEAAITNSLKKEEDGIHINTLVQLLQTPYPTLASTLTMMEMKGFVKALPGGIYISLL